MSTPLIQVKNLSKIFEVNGGFLKKADQLHAVSRRSYKLFLLKGSRLSQPSFCKSGKNS